MSDGVYEFGGYENMVIDKCGRKAHLWGIISLIVGVLLVLLLGGALIAFETSVDAADLPPDMPLSKNLIRGLLIGLLPIAVGNLVMGKLYMDSGNALKQVVTTQGNDVELLMRGLDRMGKAFRIEVFMSAVAMVIGFTIGLMMPAEEDFGGGDDIDWSDDYNYDNDFDDLDEPSDLDDLDLGEDY